MDQEIDIEMTSEGPIEVTSAAEGAPEGPIEVTSAAEGALEIKVRRYWRHDSSSSSDSIFRAPRHIRYGRQPDFEPKLVSIGPYHHGRENLQFMEGIKGRCMSDLLKLSAGGGSNIDRVVPVDPFIQFEMRARGFYKKKFKQISNDEFVRMLVLDSCFVIRVMLSLFQVKSMGFLEVNIKEVRSDLLLLENQIPLFFISVVYYWLFPDEKKLAPPPPLIDVIKYFIFLDFPWTSSDNCLDFESDHLLDFYWKGSVPCKTPLIEIMKQPGGFRQVGPNLSDHRGVTKLIANATELHQTAGIKFHTYSRFQIKKKTKNRGLQVEFSKGIMRMRCLNIDSSMVTLLVNLVAFENSMLPSIRIISTYIKLMNDLIDTEDDVELLHKFGIIYNTLSSHAMAATFFNEIGNLCLIDYSKNHFSYLFRNVDKYYKSIWNRRWTNLCNNYFDSPWAGISVFVASILLILTVLQTFYTIDGYYNPRK